MMDSHSSDILLWIGKHPALWPNILPSFLFCSKFNGLFSEHQFWDCRESFQGTPLFFKPSSQFLTLQNGSENIPLLTIWSTAKQDSLAGAHKVKLAVSCGRGGLATQLGCQAPELPLGDRCSLLCFQSTHPLGQRYASAKLDWIRHSESAVPDAPSRSLRSCLCSPSCKCNAPSTASRTASSQSFTNLVSGSRLPHLPQHHRCLCNNSPVTLSPFLLDGPPPHGERNCILLHF